MKLFKKGQEERNILLKEIEDLLETPLSYLSIFWFLLLLYELVKGLSPTLEFLLYALWAIFILDFILEFTIAPKKIKYLKDNWILAVSLFLPVLRIFRFLRFFRLARFGRFFRTLNLARLVSSVNKSRRALLKTLGERKIGYVLLLTTLITLAGASGIYYFENMQALQSSGIDMSNLGPDTITTYGDALWWTSMIMTTIGSGYWPKTLEGRLLAFILSVYAFAIFGYITAAIATILIGKKIK